jgi:cytochrome b
MATRVRVWDLPTRLFHWALALCVVGSIATGYIGGDIIQWHARLGYAILTLLLFRIVWGFVGGYWSRFASFVYSPRSVVAYLRQRAHPDHLIGHSPLGAGSVFAMLFFLLAQAATGLVSDDEISFTGPLNRFVSSARALAATWYHKEVGQRILISLVLLHVAAILFYLVKKKRNLIHAMVVGDKEVAQATRASRDTAGTRIAALLILAVCAGLVYGVVSLGG